MSNKPKLIVITGPTAVGKSALSIKLAKAMDGEIISGDSMQVYKGMDIGTAKITKDEMEGIPHHLIDICLPTDSYDVYSFKEMAKQAVSDILSRNKLPIVCGGTGFYIQALAYDIDFTNNTDLEYRESLYRVLETKGSDFLYSMLVKIDKDYAKETPKENIKRIVRALEFYHTEKITLSEHNRQQRKKDSPYDLKYFVLIRNRESLYKNIDKRVDLMVKAGLIEEARSIYNSCGFSDTAKKAIGYRELIPYFEGEWDLETAIYNIKLNSRHFAKRQLTWFRREKSVFFIDREVKTSDEEILGFMMEKINE